jgi:hypothetical protein
VSHDPAVYNTPRRNRDAKFEGSQNRIGVDCAAGMRGGFGSAAGEKFPAAESPSAIAADLHGEALR